MHCMHEGISNLHLWRSHKGWRRHKRSLLQPDRPRKSKSGPEAVCVTGCDLYSVLGIDAAATQADIRHAYRTCAKSCHPDVDSSLDARARFEVRPVPYTHTLCLLALACLSWVLLHCFRQLQMLTQCSATGACGIDTTSMAAEALVDVLPSMAAGHTVSPAAAASSAVAAGLNAVVLCTWQDCAQQPACLPCRQARR